MPSEMSHFLPISPSFPRSSELESDFNGDSSNSEVGEGETSLLELPACPSPPRRWASLSRSPVVPEESHKASKVADGKRYPCLGECQWPLPGAEVSVEGEVLNWRQLSAIWLGFTS